MRNAVLYIFLFLLFSCSQERPVQKVNQELSSAYLVDVSKKLYDKLIDKKYSFLEDSTLIYDNIILSISPYISDEEVVSVPIKGLKSSLRNKNRMMFGSEPGSGEQIELTVEEFLGQYMPVKKCQNGQEITRGEKQRGNAINNLEIAFPKHEIVEIFCPGYDVQYEGMDWNSVYFIFKQTPYGYKLRALVSDHWTP